ncbi:MAG: hypothetical protein EOM20_12680 [Spartobacteria bacterium]|nr:hypothetical protein [Spartobacteria bacterium]
MSMNKYNQKNKAGFSSSGLLLLLLALLLGVSAYLTFQNWKKERICAAQLAAIYDAVSRYEIRQGILPALQFYPVDPASQEGSLRLFLMGEGVRGDDAVCPSSPRIFRKTGQTYLWNDALNGQHLSALKEPRWMLVEMNALSTDVPPPHWGRYHVLMTDGTIRKLSSAQLREMQIPRAIE